MDIHVDDDIYMSANLSLNTNNGPVLAHGGGGGGGGISISDGSGSAKDVNVSVNCASIDILKQTCDTLRQVLQYNINKTNSNIP